MSVICAVQFADRVITRMTVFDYSGDSLEIGRALNLAVAAYESRMKHPPPLIKEPERIAGHPDILGLQFKTAEGKIETVTGAEYKRSLLFMSIFTFKPDNNNGDTSPPQHNGKRGRQRPHFRSMADWEEFQRKKDLRRIARADAALRRELLNTMDTCPCCERRLRREEDQRREGAEREAMQFARGRRLLPAE
jgi:hypothetical protein